MSAISRFLSILITALLVVTPALARQTETGFASWYNRGFHGLQTASGELYDHDAFTAAHRSLPLGTWVRVTRLDTGASVDVRINDRMPAGPGHIIDLSGAAARRLDLLRVGVSQVRAEVIPAAAAQIHPRTPGTSTAPAGPQARPATTPTTVPVETLASGTYTLQIGAFNRRDTADLMAQQFRDAYIVSYGTQTAPLFRVFLGSFRDEATARAEQSRLWDTGYDSFLRRL